MSCSKPGINAAGRSLFGALGAEHNEFHNTCRTVSRDLAARGQDPDAPASAALTRDTVTRLQTTANQLARDGTTSTRQQHTIQRHLEVADQALRAGQTPTTRDVVALRRMHAKYAGDQHQQTAVEAPTTHPEPAARVAAGQRALRRARERAVLAQTDPTAENDQRCPGCGQFLPAGAAHTCPGGGDPTLPTPAYDTLTGDQRTQQMLADLETAVAEIVRSGHIQQWLDTLATNGLNRWSLNNRMLAALQMYTRGSTNPTDWHLMGFRQWETLGRHVRKGEKAVWILAPRTAWITRTDPATGEQERIRRLVGFKNVAVFDVSQTDGTPLPSPPIAPATGEVSAGTLQGLRDRVALAGYQYEERHLADCNPVTGSGTLGYTDPARKRIVVDTRLAAAQKASTIAHELGHVHCGHVDGDYSEYLQHRGRMETEAEMTAYMVNRSRGMNSTQVNSFSPGYIATWSHGNPTIVQAAMEKATRAHRAILDGDWPTHDDTD